MQDHIKQTQIAFRTTNLAKFFFFTFPTSSQQNPTMVSTWFGKWATKMKF